MPLHARTAPQPTRVSAACVAAVVTALWHAALVAWLSTLGPRVRDGRRAVAPTDAIDIVFLPRREPAAQEAAPPPSTLARGSPRFPRSAGPSRPAPLRTATPSTLEPRSAAPPVRIDVVIGDDQWSPAPTAEPSGVVIAPRNPLAHVDRHALDVAPRLRVHMRAPRSLERYLKALAPAGYEANPCPEVARAITGLAADAAAESRALLADAVHFDARYCR
jgi:hypothetical protein